MLAQCLDTAAGRYAEEASRVSAALRVAANYGALDRDDVVCLNAEVLEGAGGVSPRRAGTAFNVTVSHLVSAARARAWRRMNWRRSATRAAGRSRGGIVVTLRPTLLQ